MAIGSPAGVRRHRAGDIQHRSGATPDRKITPRTKAIIPVHLFGQCADMDRDRTSWPSGINCWSSKTLPRRSEPNSHGRRAGSLGHIGCFSFYPTKNLGGIGDGGMLTTDDQSLADRLRLLRGHGMQPRYYHQTVGINSRLDTLQAAVLNVKLPHLDALEPPAHGQRRALRSAVRRGGLDRLICLPTTGPQTAACLEPIRRKDRRRAGATPCAST